MQTVQMGTTPFPTTFSAFPRFMVLLVTVCCWLHSNSSRVPWFFLLENRVRKQDAGTQICSWWPVITIRFLVNRQCLYLTLPTSSWSFSVVLWDWAYGKCWGFFISRFISCTIFHPFSEAFHLFCLYTAHFSIALTW